MPTASATAASGADVDSTRVRLLATGAVLFARHGVDGVSMRALHEAAGARNESAVHYHFGDRRGLVVAILERHLDAVEARRAALVERLAGDASPRELVGALVHPMADSFADELGRAHLRLVAQLSHPDLGYHRPFTRTEAPAGAGLADRLIAVVGDLPRPVAVERLATLRDQAIQLVGLRARLLDDRDPPGLGAGDAIWVENLIDQLTAGLVSPPSPTTLGALKKLGTP